MSINTQYVIEREQPAEVYNNLQSKGSTFEQEVPKPKFKKAWGDRGGEGTSGSNEITVCVLFYASTVWYSHLVP